METLGVGIIGASADRGWAKISHVPAIQSLPGMRLIAVASGSKEKGEEAARAFGADKGYASGLDLIQNPGVDVVTIAVKVPDHRDLVLVAAKAGKHVYCEWPLGRNLRESEELADAAANASIHTAIGLQLRSSAAVHQAKKLLQDGAIGRPLTANITSATAAFGPKVEPAMKFAEDSSNGVTLVTIQGAHTFDLAMAVLGDLRFISALTTTQFPDITIGEADRQNRTAEDYVLLQGLFASDVAIGIEVAGGRLPETPTSFDVVGTKGTLTLKGGAMRGVQSGVLRLVLNGEEQPLDTTTDATLPETAVNVASTYALLREDIRNDTHTTPDFAHAVRLARFVESVFASAADGSRKGNAGWPTE